MIPLGISTASAGSSMLKMGDMTVICNIRLVCLTIYYPNKFCYFFKHYIIVYNIYHLYNLIKLLLNYYIY